MNDGCKWSRGGKNKALEKLLEIYIIWLSPHFSYFAT